jgi:pectate lyase
VPGCKPLHLGYKFHFSTCCFHMTNFFSKPSIYTTALTIKSLALLFAFVAASTTLLGQLVPAFPGANGFGAQATGGRGGKVIYVTNLNPSGPGSFQEALETPGPSYILFQVSGTIPATLEIPPGTTNITVAGQTSPQGIILRGLSAYNDELPTASNLIIRHLRLRPGDQILHPTPNWISGDGLTLGGVHNAIIDHCSMAHADDEAIDISRSSGITIQHCLLAETLGEHGYLGGMLINYSSPQSRLDSISLLYNNWNRMGGRMPEISCESPECNNHRIHIEMVSNLMWDPQIETWYTGETGFGNNGRFYLTMNILDNLSIAQPSFTNGMFHHGLLDVAPNHLYVHGNALNLYPAFADLDLFYCCNDFDTNGANTDYGVCQIASQPHNFPVQEGTPVQDLQSYIYTHTGAFPRDPMDNRLLGALQTNTFAQIPINQAAANDAFDIPNNTTGYPQDTDLDGMPDYWENYHGLNPAIQDHNGLNLSIQLTGVAGYTNLECYLNCLSNYLVSGLDECGLTSNLDQLNSHPQVTIHPNPAGNLLFINAKSATPLKMELINMLGVQVLSTQLSVTQSTIPIHILPSGLYTLVLKSAEGQMLHSAIISKN